MIFGEGNQTRDFVYVDDVVDALVAVATARDVNRAVINIGSGQETSIHDLAGRVARATGREADVLYNRTQGRGVTRLVADVALAQRLLGWSPSTDLARGLRLTLEHDLRFGGSSQTGLSK